MGTNQFLSFCGLWACTAAFVAFMGNREQGFKGTQNLFKLLLSSLSINFCELLQADLKVCDYHDCHEFGSQTTNRAKYMMDFASWFVLFPFFCITTLDL